MKNKLLLEYSPATGASRWVEYLAGGHPTLPAHSGTLDDFFATTESLAPFELLLVLNSPQVSVRTLNFESGERRHILKTASYELEDSLVSDIDELHFAFTKPGENSVKIAVMDKSLLQTVLDRFADKNIDIIAVLPFAELLPAEDDQWCASAGSDSLTVRLNDTEYFTSSFEQARLAWNLASRGSEQLPSVIRFFHDSEEAAVKAQDSLPAALSSLWQNEQKPWFVGTDWPSLRSSAVNLLQGEFSPSIPWLNIWQYWRVPASFFAAGLVVYTMSAVLDNRRLQAENLQLRQQTLAAYQEAFPNSQVQDPEKAMRSHLQQLNAGGPTSRFVPLFYKSAQALGEFEGLNVLNLAFDARSNELRIDLIAKQFQDIEKIQASLAKQGIKAELVGSNSVDGGERARMKFREQAS